MQIKTTREALLAIFQLISIVKITLSIHLA